MTFLKLRERPKRRTTGKLRKTRDWPPVKTRLLLKVKRTKKTLTIQVPISSESES